MNMGGGEKLRAGERIHKNKTILENGGAKIPDKERGNDTSERLVV